MGVANGLAWTETGGEVLRVEVADTGGRGLVLTGQLGDVMKESGQAALTFARWRLAQLGIDEGPLARRQIHVHVPAGAIPKDGPSAGVTIATALVSLATGIPVRHDVAMTGEVTLRGRVLPVGGVREKALAALRAGIRTVVLPAPERARPRARCRRSSRDASASSPSTTWTRCSRSRSLRPLAGRRTRVARPRTTAGRPPIAHAKGKELGRYLPPVKLRDLGEFGLIARIERAGRPGAGLARDARHRRRRRAAAARAPARPGPSPPTRASRACTSASAQEPAARIGRRALAANLSDLAAMGARPLGLQPRLRGAAEPRRGGRPRPGARRRRRGRRAGAAPSSAAT